MLKVATTFSKASQKSNQRVNYGGKQREMPIANIKNYQKTKIYRTFSMPITLVEDPHLPCSFVAE
jgi:hypothetical protein